MRIVFIALFLVSFLFSKDIGIVEKVVVDDTENQVALVQRGEEVLFITSAGFKVQKKDIIKTFKASKLKIRFIDDTIIYIGPKTTLEIAQYYYDKQNKQNNKTNFKIKQGSYKIKTGDIEKLAPKQFKIETQFSTIGIRGWK